jgi:hypothetical protein
MRMKRSTSPRISRWSVKSLRALRATDPHFSSMVDGQLGKINSDKIEVGRVTNNKNKLTKKARGPQDQKSEPFLGRTWTLRRMESGSRR